MRRGIAVMGLGMSLACGSGDVAPPSPPVAVPPKAAAPQIVAWAGIVDLPTDLPEGTGVDADTKAFPLAAENGIHGSFRLKFKDELVADEPSRMVIAYEGDDWLDLRLIVVEFTRADRLLVRITSPDPANVLPTDQFCGADHGSWRRPTPDGGDLTVCFTKGHDKPHGPFRITDKGGPRLEGEFADGQRTGTWTMRDEAHAIATQGDFANGVPTGTWSFGGRPVVFTDGKPADADWAALDTYSGLGSYDYGETTLKVLDANLDQGLVAVEFRSTLPNSEDCKYPDLPANGGFTLAILRAGKREPLGMWEVWAQVGDPAQCSTPESAKKARAEADAAFAANGMSATANVEAVPKEALKVGPDDAVKVVEVPVSLVEQFRTPELAGILYTEGARCWTESTATASRRFCVQAEGRVEPIVGIERDGRSLLIYEEHVGENQTLENWLVSPVLDGVIR